MVPKISGVFLLLGICISHVSVADDGSVASRCLALVRACMNKFHKLQDNPFCRDLQEAIHCLNTSDSTMCDSPVATHEMEEGANQSNESIQRELEANQSEESAQSSDQQTRNDKSGSQPNWDSHISQDIGSHSYRKRQAEATNVDYIESIVEMIKDAKLEYEKNCSIQNSASSSNCQVRSTEGTVLIGFLVTLYLTSRTSND